MTSSIEVLDLNRPFAGDRQIIDIRSPSEFATGHIPTAINIPLDQIESRIHDLNSEASIVLVCQVGKRARMAAALLDSCRLSISVLDGGTDAWIKAGLPVVANSKTRWSLERQVRFGAGAMVLAGATLAFTVNAHWLFLCAFVGLGLIFAGATDICPMAELLILMPWNGNSHCRLATDSAARVMRDQ
jgi:rhodanese-related sulfurtransferase